MFLICLPFFFVKAVHLQSNFILSEMQRSVAIFYCCQNEKKNANRGDKKGICKKQKKAAEYIAAKVIIIKKKEVKKKEKENCMEEENSQ